MASSTLEASAFYGLRTDVKGNALYVTSEKVLYPAGGVIVLHDYKEKTQQYITLEETKKTVTIICLSPNRKFVAVVKKGSKPSLSIYDLASLSCVKNLGVPFESAAHEFVSVSFTNDSKNLVAILGAPDWTMLCYNWQNGKVESTTKAVPPNSSASVSQVVCNPSDGSVVCIVGNGLFRLLNVTETVWRQFGFQKADTIPIICVCWLTFDCVICGTKDGRLLLVESGELKAMYKASEISHIDIKLKDESATSSSSNITVVDKDSSCLSIEVHDIEVFPRGFAFSCGVGTVHLFEKKSSHIYEKINIIMIPTPDFSDRLLDLNYIQNLNVDDKGDQLLATTNCSQIYAAQLWESDNAQKTTKSFSLLGEQLHHGPITSLTSCPWKPIFMTCGETDRTVRIWNYQTEKQELIKQYQEEIYCVALHPTGLYTAVGYFHKLTLMVILIDDLRPMKDFPIQKCRECVFSTNGHLLAAVNENVIHIYSCISFENILNLKGHNGKILGLSWTNTDDKLISCGADGAIYEWDILKGNRMNEIIIKSCVFSGVCVTSSGDCSFSVGADGQLRQMKNSTVTTAVKVTVEKLNCVVLTHNNLILFVASTSGTVMSVSFPLHENTEIIKYKMHSYAVTRMCVTHDDNILVTSSEDGTLCLWKIISTEMKQRELNYSEDILINKGYLLELLSSIKALEVRMHELQVEHDYQVRQNEIRHADKLRDIHDESQMTVVKLNQKIEQLETDHTLEIGNMKDENITMRLNHERAVQKLESDYEKKLIVEYNKYSSLQEETQNMKLEYERKLADLSQEKVTALQELTKIYEGQLKEKELQLEKSCKDMEIQLKDHEAIKTQIEDDADKEIMDLKTQYEKILKEERDFNAQLRTETGVMKNKFKSSQKDIEDYKNQISIMQAEQQTLLHNISVLESDITDLKNEISERDRSIEEKEKRISELMRKTQDLEKFKYVLSFKIEELKSQIEPKDAEIKNKEAQIQNMEKEFLDLQKMKTHLRLCVNNLNEKLKGKEAALHVEHQGNMKNKAILLKLQSDLQQTTELIQDAVQLKSFVKVRKLIEDYGLAYIKNNWQSIHPLKYLGVAISLLLREDNLYHKYGESKTKGIEDAKKMDMHAELMRQRQHLEETVQSLRNQVYKNTLQKQKNTSRIMQENKELLTELNMLRKKLKQTQDHCAELEALIGVNKRCMSPEKARACLEKAIRNNEAIEYEYQQKLNENETTIRLLNEEIQRLIRVMNKKNDNAQDKLLMSTRELHRTK